ncbi:MAG: tetratricopeptide repeat protein [Bdellovibrionales bacterium]|nr:tetratricopeptide repeat protein [Bdellovibrionales bacterium]
MRIYGLLASLFFLSGCLLTHKEVMEDMKLSHSDPAQEPSNEITNSKKKLSIRKEGVFIDGVSVTEKFSLIDTSIRELRGQIETANKKQKDRMDQTEQGLLALIQALELQVAALSNKIERKKESKPEKKLPENFFEKAEKFFKEENWKAAIINYEKYREKNKKGSHYKKSTFQIGVCFEKLGMPKEAKVFFREVVESFPNSVEAKEAKKRLSVKTKKK